MKQLDTIIQNGQNPSGPFVIPGYFTVDTAAASVEVEYADAGVHDVYEHYLVSGYGSNNLRNYERFTIVSMGILLPLSFQLHSDYAKVRVKYPYLYGSGIDDADLPDLGDGKFIIPFANYEYPVGLTYNLPDLDVDGNFQIGAKVFDPDDDPLEISMLNVPDSLDEEVFYCRVFMKIEHNREMF